MVLLVVLLLVLAGSSRVGYWAGTRVRAFE
jgi:hypothetical protein